MNKQISQVHSPRLQRLRLKLLKYDIDIEYLPGKYLHIADLLSRNYSSEIPEHDADMNEMVHSVEKYLRMSENRKKEFREYTIKDKVLSKVIECCEKGWNEREYKEEMKVFYQLRSDLHVNNDMLFFNDRVVVPSVLRGEMLNLLHEGHFGVNRTRDRAQTICFWPGMSKEIEQMVQRCKLCEKYRHANRKDPLKPHEIPELPFQKVGSDILDFGGKSYVVIADYLTKWLEIILLKNKQSSSIIEVFK